MVERYQHRRSTVATQEPDSLLVGEVALNLTDEQVFVGKADGSPKKLAEMAGVAAGIRALVGPLMVAGANMSIDVNPTTGAVTFSAAGGGGGVGGFRRGIRVGFIGTSLIQNNVQSSVSQISHSSRGWVSWARFFSRGQFFSPIWYDANVYTGWEPSGTAGATRYFRGLNAGVFGQTIAQVAARKEFLAASVQCDLIVIDGGTNDIATLGAVDIQTSREAIADYYLGLGIPVIMLTIPARSLAQWPAGDSKRQKAAWINQMTRDYCKGKQGLELFDWNESWGDLTGTSIIPKTNYSYDGLHKTQWAGADIGEKFAAFLATRLPLAQRPVWANDDQYNALNNPWGNLLSNPMCFGTAGSLTDASGQVADGMRVERIAGDGLVSASKAVRSDGRGEWQIVTLSPGAADTTARFGTSTANIATSFPVDTWLKASCEVEIPAHAYIKGVTLYLWDTTAGLTVADMTPDPNQAIWANRSYAGLLETPAIRVSVANPTMRCRVEMTIGNTGEGASADMVVKVGTMEFRPVESPQAQVGYVGG